MKIALVVSTFNPDIGNRLVEGALRAFGEHKIGNADIAIISVPGSLELAPMIARLDGAKKYDGFIAIGSVIKGETHHFESVCEGTTYGLQKVSIEKNVPVMNCVLMCYTKDQAHGRSGADQANKGYECARGLMTMIELYKKN